MSSRSNKRALSPAVDCERTVKQKISSEYESNSSLSNGCSAAQGGCIVPGTLLPNLTVDALINKQIKRVSPSSYSGSWVCLIFYPYDFEESQSSQLMSECCKRAQDFRELQCEVLFCSTDSAFCHLAWSNSGVFEPACPTMLSDGSREFSKQLGLLDKKKGIARRAVLIVDPQQIVQQVLISNDGCGQSADSLLAIVQELQLQSIN